MRILLFGSNGQLGRALQSTLGSLGTVISVARARDPKADFMYPTEIVGAVRMHAPDVIVDAAAFTAVDDAEIHANTALTINSVTPTILGQVAAELGAWLVYYSTDYVFDGSGTRPWHEADQPAPLNMYGLSKLLGEEGIRRSHCRHLIFRTSWLYAPWGNNFALTILQRACTQKSLAVVDDQFGVPTPAELVASVTSQALHAVLYDGACGGTYHLVPTGETTWYRYASYLLRQAREEGIPVCVSSDNVKPLTSEQLSVRATRPVNSRLDTRKLSSTFGIRLPSWESGVDRMIKAVRDRSSWR